MPNTLAPTWSEDRWRENILRYQLRLRAESVKRLAAKLEHSGDFPTETPKKLAQLIKHSADVVGRHLVTAPADQLRHVNLLLCLIGEQFNMKGILKKEETAWYKKKCLTFSDLLRIVRIVIWKENLISRKAKITPSLKKETQEILEWTEFIVKCLLQAA